MEILYCISTFHSRYDNKGENIVFYKTIKNKKFGGHSCKSWKSSGGWNNDNDAPIVKVQGYKKMYRIRPQYMITFLSLLNALSLRYSKLILEKYDNDKKFKDSEELKKQFEDLKVTYFENPLSRIEKSAKEILTQSKNILNSAEKIHSLINKIIDDDLENARRKIETFEVEFNRYTRKLDKLEKE